MNDAKELLYDDFVVGHEYPPVRYVLEPDRVTKYVEAVEDPHPLYTDEAVAARSRFGGLIAPPAIAAIMTTLRIALQDATMPPGAIHAKQYFKFVRPLRPGDTLEIRVRLLDKYEKRGRKWVVIGSTVTNQKGEEVIVARISGIWPR